MHEQEGQKDHVAEGLHTTQLSTFQGTNPKPRHSLPEALHSTFTKKDKKMSWRGVPDDMKAKMAEGCRQDWSDVHEQIETAQRTVHMHDTADDEQ